MDLFFSPKEEAKGRHSFSSAWIQLPYTFYFVFYMWPSSFCLQVGLATPGTISMFLAVLVTCAN